MSIRNVFIIVPFHLIGLFKFYHQISWNIDTFNYSESVSLLIFDHYTCSQQWIKLLKERGDRTAKQPRENENIKDIWRIYWTCNIFRDSTKNQNSFATSPLKRQTTDTDILESLAAKPDREGKAWMLPSPAEEGGLVLPHVLVFASCQAFEAIEISSSSSVMSNAVLNYCSKLKISLAKGAHVYFVSALGTLDSPLARWFHGCVSTRDHVILSSL